MEEDIKVYTVKEAAEILKISTDFVYDCVANGKLDCYRFGRAYRFSQKHLEALLEKLEQKAEE